MHVDGFRFDLASALARELHEVDRAGRVLRHHPPGPGALAGEADRRAVGPRRGRLPGRQLPRRLDRVERQVPRHACAASGSGDGGAVSEFATRLRRQQRPLRAQRPPAVRQHQLHHRATTASRCTTWSATTRSTTRPTARTTATATNDNLSWNCGVEGPDRRPGDPRPARAAEAQPPGDAAALAGRADAPRRRRARPARSSGNNNAYCQDNEHQLARLGPRRRSSSELLDFTRRLIRLRQRAPGAAPPALLPGPRASAARTSRTSPGSTRPAAR